MVKVTTKNLNIFYSLSTFTSFENRMPSAWSTSFTLSASQNWTRVCASISAKKRISESHTMSMGSTESDGCSSAFDGKSSASDDSKNKIMYVEFPPKKYLWNNWRAAVGSHSTRISASIRTPQTWAFAFRYLPPTTPHPPFPHCHHPPWKH